MVRNNQRWFMLFLFSWLSCLNSFQWISFATLETKVKPHYGVSDQAYTLLSTIFGFVYVAGAWVGTLIIERYGLRTALILAALFNTAGTVLKCFSTNANGYNLALASQLLGALGQLMFLAAPTKVAVVWFAKDQWALATSLAVLANLSGPAFSFLIAPAMVPLPFHRHDFETFVTGLAITSGINCLLVLVFFRNGPEASDYASLSTEDSSISSPSTPPAWKPSSIDSVSHASPHNSRHSREPHQESRDSPDNYQEFPSSRDSREDDEGEEGLDGHLPLRTALSLLGKDIHFIILAVTTSIGLSSLWEFSTILPQTLSATDQNYPASIIDNLAFAFIVSGLVGTFVTPFLVRCCGDKPFKRLIVSCFAIASLSQVSFTLLLLFGGEWPGHLTSISFALFGAAMSLGFCLSAAVPACLELAAEMTYPVGEEITSGLIFWGGNLGYVVLVLLANVLQDDVTGSMRKTSWVILGCLATSCVALCGIKARHKRAAAANEGR